MAGSVFGTMFRTATWGESHGKGLGVVVDGCPAGLPLCEEDIQKYLDRRRPGQNAFTTARKEGDQVEIMSGVFEGKTTGTPVSMIIFNHDQRSRDYSQIASLYRPGHADLTFDRKYGFRDYRGGGRSSGRETIGRVAAGAVAAKCLAMLGVYVTAYTASIGPVEINRETADEKRILSGSLFMPDADAEKKAEEYLRQCIDEHTSAGGSVECIVRGLPAGIGEPVFDKLDALLGKALFSIGAVKAVEIGDGIQTSRQQGHEVNDMYAMSGPGQDRPEKLTNHAGGIYGGISDGSEIRVRAYFKPTPSVSRPQQALHRDGTVREITIGGRHDPVIVPRAVVVVECMTALTVLDLMLQGMSATMEGVMGFYRSPR